MALEDLASLNARILAVAAEEGTEEDVPELNTSQFNTNTGEGAAPPGADDGDPEFKGFSATDKLSFEQIVNWISDQVFLGDTSGKTTAIDAFVNAWGVQWRTDQGFSSTDQITRVPTLDDLVNREDFLNGAVWLPLTVNNAIPPVFESTTFDEAGNETPAVGVASITGGVEFIEIEPTLAELKKRPQTLFEVVRRSGTDLIRRALGGGVGTEDETARAAAEGVSTTPSVNQATGFTTGQTGQLNLPDYIKSAVLYSDPAAEGRVPTSPLPILPQPDLVKRLVETTTPSTGGGGRAGRRDLVVDEDQLRSQTANLWSQWLREPANDAKVNSIVSEYVREAGSFWRTKGGQLDFGTFVENKLKAEPRYQLLYRNKPPELSELQYQQSFSAPVSSIGLRPDLASAETTRAILSGGSPEGQFQRISRTREATQGGTTLSQRFARTLAGLRV